MKSLKERIRKNIDVYKRSLYENSFSVFYECSCCHHILERTHVTTEENYLNSLVEKFKDDSFPHICDCSDNDKKMGIYRFISIKRIENIDD